MTTNEVNSHEEQNIKKTQKKRENEQEEQQQMVQKQLQNCIHVHVYRKTDTYTHVACMETRQKKTTIRVNKRRTCSSE